mgnify:CR=1 FL=1
MRCSACLWTKASSIADSGRSLALYLDAGLVALVALLAVIVLGDSMMQWYGYVVLKRVVHQQRSGGDGWWRLAGKIADDDSL